MKKIKPIFILGFVLTLLVVSGGVRAGEQNAEGEAGSETLPRAVTAGLDYLLSLVNQRGALLDPDRVVPLIEFASRKNYPFEKVQPSERQSGKGICLKTTVAASLERILRYAYNPQIPNFVVYPSVLRLSGWYPGSEIGGGKRPLWKELNDLNRPFLAWGKEYEVNTPDSFSGAYYRYDLERVLGLMKHRRGRVAVSISKMPDKSSVGKKAVIIDEKNWNYFYSGIDGLNLSIIGGMDTYMYDSESVVLYYQADKKVPRTIVMVFKWLRAGWAGINVVKPHHIYEGSTRFAEGMKAVMEADGLPPAEVFAEDLNYLRNLSERGIEAKIREYSTNFEKIAEGHRDMAKPDFARIIKRGGYGEVLNREERLGVLTLEFLKRYVGKPTLVKLASPALRKENQLNTAAKARLKKLEGRQQEKITFDLNS